MLGTALWYAVALGLMAAVLMDGAAAFARAGVQAAADHAVEAALHDAVAGYQNRLGAAIAARDPASLPTSAPAAAAPGMQGYAAPIAAVATVTATQTPVPQTAAAGPRFTVASTVTPTTVAAPACAPAAANGADTIAWLQCNSFVQESRLSLRVTVRVFDGDGAQLLAQREQSVTLRLFDVPPYSAVVGRKDGSADSPAGGDALAPPAHEGDVGGGTVSGAPDAPQPSPRPAAGNDTLIHVRFSCTAGACSNAAPPDPDADLRPGARWTNGNAPPR